MFSEPGAWSRALALACLLIGIAQIVLGVRTFEVLADRGTSSGVHELASVAASAP